MRMQPTAFLLALIAALLGCASCLAPASAPPFTYRLRPLLPPEHPTAEEWQEYLHAFHAEPDPTQPLPPPQPPESFHRYTFPTSMNDAGSVCGSTRVKVVDLRNPTPGSPQYTFVTRPFAYVDGAFQVIPVGGEPGASWNGSYAVDINERNEVVGFLWKAPPVPYLSQPFLWDGESVDLLEGVTGDPVAINDDGLILTRDGLFEDGELVFAPPPANDLGLGYEVPFRPFDLGNDGTIVGTYGGHRAALWKDGLRTLLPEQARSAYAINKQGVVVISWKDDCGVHKALWHDGTVSPVIAQGALFFPQERWAYFNDDAALVGYAFGALQNIPALYENGKLYNLTELVSNYDEDPTLPKANFSSCSQMNNSGDILAVKGGVTYIFERENAP